MIQTMSSPKPDKPRPKRALTTLPQAPLPPPTSTNTAPRPRRSQSTDQQPLVSARSSAEERNTSSNGASGTGRSKKEKKASTHADKIDMMDFSGVGHMLHHDGPFDACAPSRNKHRTRAPMGVFDDGTYEAAAPLPAPPVAAVTPAPKPLPSPLRPVHNRSRSSTTPTAPNIVINPLYSPPISANQEKKKNAIAEAWGTADPEPFEEFSAGGGASTYAGYNVQSNGNAKPNGTAYHEYWNDNDVARNTSRNARRARALPPPQQIALPGSNFDIPYQQEDSPTSSDSKAGTPTDASFPPTAMGPTPPRFKRTKSLMQRIRTMRENPNVPVGAPDPDEDYPVQYYQQQQSQPYQPAALSPRDPYSGHGHAYSHSYSTSPMTDEPLPVLYSQSSLPPKQTSEGKKSGTGLLNRLTRSPRQGSMPSATSPPVSPLQDDGFVVVPRVQSPKAEKALPSLPGQPYQQAGGDRGYFDSRGGAGGPPTSPAKEFQGGQVLGRRRSLLSKMKGVARK